MAVHKGRTRSASCRPIVTKQQAWVLLPTYCGTRPGGGRYGAQGRGDVIGIPSSAARIVVEVSQPIAYAELQLLGPENYDPKRPGSEQGPERVTRVVKMTPAGDDRHAEATFDLRPEESGYRVVVANEYKFTNVPPPRAPCVIPEEARRSCCCATASAPTPTATSKVSPCLWAARSAFRMSLTALTAWVRPASYIACCAAARAATIPPRSRPGWALPLPEVKPGPDAGPFDPKRGVFATMKFDQEVPFHAVPSANPDALGRTLGGGRYFLKTRGLIDAKGRPIEARLGDQIEYCVEILADKNPDADRPRARSETRVATVVTIEQFLAWSQSIADEERRLRQLDQLQRGVFNEGDEE